ncbi:hypothetical protein SAMN05216419_10438 [Nitrosomonas cryotolerans]|uniref:YD repeat-containing protein n=1 Tax=Nitrosomonas cryotolerans ATCC 49181 TaxID=1131553 RepID=A0A1N6F877_9PROT|nr:hypothetical protein SAMN05216419_10438 [Nitrosomonas cryotolerans]SIN91449.1 hypothetical protein SAMN02743940_0139 [Nitrosomonas cryotolerans ATCC 49181]
MRIFKAIALIMVMSISACTSTNSIMNSWIGYSVDDLTASWGAPSSRISRADGGSTYTWSTLSSDQYGIHECRKTFVTDSTGTVTQWSYNGCPKLVLK